MKENTILAKLTFKELELEKPEGLDTVIFGSQVMSFEKVEKVPEYYLNNRLVCQNEDWFDEEDYHDSALGFYDDCGIVDLYARKAINDAKHAVFANELYSAPHDGSLNESEIYEFSIDSWSKFVYMFKKYGRLFQYTL